jgi:GNAT superfamily N-acetyltransferase
LTEVKQLGSGDLPAAAALRRQALEGHPRAFSSSWDEDRLSSPETAATLIADPSASVILGAFEAGALMGMVGLARTAGAKRRHKAIVWGMYVVPSARGRGLGRALVKAAVAAARTWPGVEQVHLSVTDAAPEARRLYEQLGFQAWGREVRAVQWEGQFTDETHLVLVL